MYTVSFFIDIEYISENNIFTCENINPTFTLQISTALAPIEKPDKI